MVRVIRVRISSRSLAGCGPSPLARLVALRRVRRVQLADGTPLYSKDWNNHPARS